jgi:hypothetical protein
MFYHKYITRSIREHDLKEIWLNTVWGDSSPMLLDGNINLHIQLVAWTLPLLYEAWLRKSFKPYNLLILSYLGTECMNQETEIKCLEPPLWSSGQSSWLQIQRSGFDPRHCQTFWEVVCLERDPHSPVSTTEELLGRKSRGSGLGNR